MRRISRSRVATVERPDLRAAEGIITGTTLSVILWMLMLALLH